MKKNILAILLLVFSISAYSQNAGPIKFLGIPIDGPESVFVSHLTAKGFAYDKVTDSYKGEFNGEKVDVGVLSYHGNVRTVCVIFPLRDKDLAKFQYNELLSDFANNPKYTSTGINRAIPDNEDIKYQISNNRTGYLASFGYFDETRDALTYYKELREKTTYYLYNNGWFTTMEQSYEFVQLISQLTQESTQFNFIVSQKPFLDFWERIIEGEKTPGMQELLQRPEPEITRQEKLCFLYALAYAFAKSELADGIVQLALSREGLYYRVVLLYKNSHNKPNGEDL